MIETAVQCWGRLMSDGIPWLGMTDADRGRSHGPWIGRLNALSWITGGRLALVQGRAEGGGGDPAIANLLAQ